jgi:hypothetical protein
MDISTSLDELNLTLSSVLRDLPLWDKSLELCSLGNSLIQLFDKEPLMPGVVLTKNQDYIGMISRRRFFEFMSRPYSLGLFNDRALGSLYKFLESDILVTSADTTIVEATQQALSRNSEFVYEPIVVESAIGNKLLDIQQLLLANSKIHALTLAQLEQIQKELKASEKHMHYKEQKYVELVEKEKALVLEEIVLNVQREVTSPAKLVVGNLVHASRYIQELIQLVDIYQKHYPQPVEEIKILAEKIKVNSINIELPRLLNTMKGDIRKIQGFGDLLGEKSSS